MPSYHDFDFDFSVDIPDHWHFMPSAWSPLAQGKRRDAAESAPDALLQFALTPFCCAMAHHEAPGKEQPTLQVTARASRIPEEAEALALLNFQIEMLRDEPEGFVVEQATHEARVAGHRANFLQVTSMARVEVEDLVAEVGVRSRMYLVFTPGIAFTVSLTSSDDPAYYDEADLAHPPVDPDRRLSGFFPLASAFKSLPSGFSPLSPHFKPLSRRLKSLARRSKSLPRHFPPQ